MVSGTVKWFNDAKGFGFIEPEGGGEDVFAHFSAIQMVGFRTLKQGEKVEFELAKGPKGQLAQNIRSLADAVPAADSVAAATPDLTDVPLAPVELVVAASAAAGAAAASLGSVAASAG